MFCATTDFSPPAFGGSTVLCGFSPPPFFDCFAAAAAPFFDPFGMTIEVYNVHSTPTVEYFSFFELLEELEFPMLALELCATSATESVDLRNVLFDSSTKVG